MDHIARIQGQSDQLWAATERAQTDPSPVNRLEVAETSLRLLASQAVVTAEALVNMQKQLLEQPVRMGDSQTVGSGVAFLRDSNFLSVTICERAELRVRLADNVRLVLAARDEPIRADIKDVDGRSVLDVEILDVQRGGEVYVRHLLPVVTVAGNDAELTLEFSFTSLGGNLDSPMRLCWSLSRSEGSRDE